MTTETLSANISEGLLENEFEIGKTKFYLSKLPAMAAYALLEQIRHEIGKTGNEVPESADPENTFPLVKLVLALDPKFVEGVRRELFEKVEFTDPGNPRQKLAGAEDFAFNGLEPIAVYEVLLRSLAVNFSPSLRSVASGLGRFDLIGNPPSP